jgi:hypothetical protein
VKPDPKWKKFEKIIADIQRQLTPNATVIHNYKIAGKRGRKRQIDVYIEQKFGFVSVVTIVECKNRKRPITIDEIEAFPIKMKDVNANAGIVISTSGFSDGVADFAKEYNFKLMEYRKADETDWNELLGEHTWLNIVKPRITNARHYLRVEATKEFIEVGPKTVLFDSKSKSIDSLEERILTYLVESSPNFIFLPELQLLERVDDTYIKNKDSDYLIKVDEIHFLAEIQPKLFTLNFKLNEGEVITNSETGEKEYITLTSEWVEWKRDLEHHEGISISKEEALELLRQSTQSFSVDTAYIKPYIRAKFSRKPKT